jgi:NAD(P)H-hydrate repair Nnr-like enzyme with NAD(P)H-hydrate dehydratase domain
MIFDADALNVLSGLEPSEWPKRRNWGNIVLTPHMGEYMRLISAVMKRGANVSLAPSTAVLAEAALNAGAQPAGASAKKLKSLVETDDAPSTADGVALDLPEPPADAPSSSSDAPPDSSIENQKSGGGKIENPPPPDRTPLAELLARGTGTIVVLKGHRSVITNGHQSTINLTGNPAMATAGSGDVLTGMIAALIGQKMSPLDAAILGAHVHGQAADLARHDIAPHAVGLLSTDIIAHIPEALAEHITE